MMDTIAKGTQLMYASLCRIWVACINEKHVRFYQRFFDAEIVSRKIATIDREIEIPMLLMQGDVEKAWNTLNAHARDRR